MKSTDKAWLAGFLEGEGSFVCMLAARNRGSSSLTWRITASSTDEDVIRRAAALMGAKLFGPYQRRAPAKKQNWIATVARREEALTLASELRPLMGARRQEQIDEMLLAAQLHPRRRKAS